MKMKRIHAHQGEHSNERQTSAVKLVLQVALPSTPFQWWEEGAVGVKSNPALQYDTYATRISLHLSLTRVLSTKRLLPYDKLAA